MKVYLLKLFSSDSFKRINQGFIVFLSEIQSAENSLESWQWML